MKDFTRIRNLPFLAGRGLLIAVLFCVTAAGVVAGEGTELPGKIAPPGGPNVIYKRGAFQEAINERLKFVEDPIKPLFDRNLFDPARDGPPWWRTRLRRALGGSPLVKDADQFAETKREPERKSARINFGKGLNSNTDFTIRLYVHAEHGFIDLAKFYEIHHRLNLLIKNYLRILNQIQENLAAGANASQINSLVKDANQQVDEFNEHESIVRFNQGQSKSGLQLLLLPAVPKLGTPWSGLMDRVNGNRNKINATVKSESKQERKRGEKTPGKSHGNGCTGPCCSDGTDR